MGAPGVLRKKQNRLKNPFICKSDVDVSKFLKLGKFYNLENPKILFPGMQTLRQASCIVDFLFKA